MGKRQGSFLGFCSNVLKHGCFLKMLLSSLTSLTRDALHHLGSSSREAGQSKRGCFSPSLFPFLSPCSEGDELTCLGRKCHRVYQDAQSGETGSVVKAEGIWEVAECKP